jgi:bifunctional UDP-N-acetylglucosamine pyrophosphorylase/glucosamine-1-phosphate N-acetyltransferase
LLAFSQSKTIVRKVKTCAMSERMIQQSNAEAISEASHPDQSQSNIAAIIIATDHGQRMYSAKPKVLHECAGLPLIAHTVRLAMHVGAGPLVLVVSPLTLAPIRTAMQVLSPEVPLIYAVQEEQQGAWDAARVGLAAVPQQVQQVVILHGNMPLLQQSDLVTLKEAANYASLAVLTAPLDEPTHYERIVRDNRDQVERVIEQQVAEIEQLGIEEVDTGIYWVDVDFLRQAFADIDNDTSQTKPVSSDIVQFARARGNAKPVQVAEVHNVRSINDRIDLGEVERIMRDRLVRKHQATGVTFLDPKRVYIGMDVTLAQDVTIGLDVALHGNTVVCRNVTILGPTVIIDCHIEEDVHISAFSHLQNSRMARHAVIGPYARVRADSSVGCGAFVGNFVELKNAVLADNAKVGHLSYIGDANLGCRANIGGGTITCNYDSVNKHRTTIGEGAFVGSNNTLVAPVTLGDRCFTAAGSTITEDVPPEALAFGRARQSTIEGRGKLLRERLAHEQAGDRVK